MSQRRREIDAALRASVVPKLRELGFRGSYPHFYKDRGNNHLDLLTFQFRLDGSSFIVEIAYADPLRKNVYFRPDTPANKLYVSATTKRCRLGSAGRSGVDGEWLQLDPGTFSTRAAHFTSLARKVEAMVLNEAMPWWEARAHET